MSVNYYKKVAALLKYLEDNNIVLESCGCCDSIIIDGEGGWDTGNDYIIVSNEEIKQWLKKHKVNKNDK